nr:RUS family member 1 isoform X5 [Kogia breviceps]
MPLCSRRSRARHVFRPRFSSRGTKGRNPGWHMLLGVRINCAPSSSAPGRPGAAAPPPTGACSGRPGGGAGGGSPGPSQRNPEDEMGAKGWLPGLPSHLFPGSWLSSCLRASPIASARTICPTSCGIPCRFNWHAGPHHLCLVDGNMWTSCWVPSMKQKEEEGSWQRNPGMASLPGGPEGWEQPQDNQFFPLVPHGSKMDCNAKQWRLFADILNDVAMFLEIMAPIFPVCFTMTICISNLAKCIVGVAGGATRAALTMHQARRNNMADVSAKDGSQETLVSLAGLLVSLLMLPLVSDCPSLSLGCFFFLTALHIYANYRAVRALVIETLNEGRLWLVLKHFLQRGEVLGPASANQMEPLWTGFWPSLSLSLGVPLHRVTSSVFELQKLVEGHQEPYLLRWDQSQTIKDVQTKATSGSCSEVVVWKLLGRSTGEQREMKLERKGLSLGLSRPGPGCPEPDGRP